MWLSALFLHAGFYGGSPHQFISLWSVAMYKLYWWGFQALLRVESIPLQHESLHVVWMARAEVSFLVWKWGELDATLSLKGSRVATSFWHCKSCNSLKKLKNIGLSPSALQWFESYLFQRYQAVRKNSVLSDKLPVASGVRQESVLEALLFSVYVNDLPSVCQNCSTA